MVEICTSYYCEVFTCICEFSLNWVLTLSIGVVLHEPVKLKMIFVNYIGIRNTYIHEL